MSLVVRERPPLSVSHSIKTPSGHRVRWAEDEHTPGNALSSLQFSSAAVGGFESADGTLPRKPGASYSDLEELSDWTIYGAGGDVLWNGRLERAPRQSGSESSISPSGVGHQANLEDNKSVKALYVDRDISRWGVMSVQRKINIITAGWSPQDPAGAQPDDTTGAPSLSLDLSSGWSQRVFCEAWYDAGGVPIGSINYAWKKAPSINSADPSWHWFVHLMDDDVATAFVSTADLRGSGPGSGVLTTTTGSRKFALVQLSYDTAVPNPDPSIIWWTVLAVYGTHGLTKRGVQDALNAQGFYASDIVRHAVTNYADQLKVTADSIQATDFVIPHLAFLDPTTCAEIVKQANRFHLYDWAVWEDKTFWYYKRGQRGRKWRARIGPAKLSETGPQVDRLWESVVVQYQDVSGKARTVGPPGSGADTISSLLKDPDATNPANRLAMVRRDLLSMGTGTVESAIKVGQRFLAETKQLDTSGRAELVGYVEDDRGVLWPASKVRGGDQLCFVDASDTSYRRIVKADYSHQTRTVSVDLDSPPEGLQAILERLQVVLVPLGIG